MRTEAKNFCRVTAWQHLCDYLHSGFFFAPFARTSLSALAKVCGWRRVVGMEANDKPPRMGLRRRRQLQTAAKAEPEMRACWQRLRYCPVGDAVNTSLYACRRRPAVNTPPEQ